MAAPRPLPHLPSIPCSNNYKYHQAHLLLLTRPLRPSPLHREIASPPAASPRAPSRSPKGDPTNPSQMAVLNLCIAGGDDDKENAPPPPSAARRVAVKNHTVMKRPGLGSRAMRRRPPLRDITGLFLAAQLCRPPPALAGAEVAETARAAGDIATDGVTLKQGRYSLRKAFR